MDRSRVSEVILWSNGMVMCFDNEGEQAPSLQGVASPELVASIVAYADLDTRWTTGEWRTGELRHCSREAFMKAVDSRG